MSQPIESVGKWISTINRYSQIYKTRNFAEYGIDPGPLGFLLMLYEKDGVSQDFLAKQLYMDKTTAARAIQKLEHNGLVTRQPYEEDRRVNLVFLTEDALKIRENIQSTMYKWTDILTQGFSAEEKSLLLHLLKRAAGNAVNYINEAE